MRKFKPGINNLIIYIILVLSTLNLLNQFASFNVASTVISVVGLLAVALYFSGHKFHRKLIWIWIVAQLISIVSHGVDTNTGVAFANIIYDASQLFKIRFGLSLSADSSKLVFDFNILVILYFFLFKQLKISAHIGKSYELGIQENSPIAEMNNLSPMVIFTEKVQLDEDKNWLLGDLSSPITLNGIEYSSILVKFEDALLTNVILAVPSDMQVKQKANSAGLEPLNWLFLK